MRVIFHLAALLGGALALLAACQGDNEEVLPEPRPTAGATEFAQTFGELEVRLKLDNATYTQGELIQMTLTLTNTSDTTITLFYRDGQRFEFEVSASGGRPTIWRWSADRAFIQALGKEILGPGETLTYSETWAQRDNDGQSLPAGRYEARGTVVGCRNQSLTDCGFAVGGPLEITP